MHEVSQPLHAECFPLWGSSLIEASAGTGKTWTIAALYLRLVLGHGRNESRFTRPLMPSEILVMTFTRAATRELSDRIRARLLEAARCFRGEAEPMAEDDYLRGLLVDYPAQGERQLAAWRLAMAAECMDEASVHTIDAWCQRMLREHAFDSGSLFEEELVADEQALLTQAVQDYWRKQCYGLAAPVLNEVLDIWSGVDPLLTDVKALLGKLPTGAVDVAATLAQVLQRAQSELREQLKELRHPWRERVAQMRSFVLSQDPPNAHGWDGRRFSIQNITGWLDTLQRWAEASDAAVVPDLAAGWLRLRPAGLDEARKVDAGPVHMSPAETEAFEAFAGLQASLHKLPTPSAAVRLHAAASVAQHLRQLKRQKGQFGFSDMLERLDAALKGPNGDRLRERIAAQYPVALIDEFQDTSPIQYSIFDQIYRVADNAPERALLLIGDPKQSIYGFRGADIYSYLQARLATQGRHYALSVNYRSTQALVKAVNHSFLQAEMQLPGGAFLFKAESAGQPGNPLPFVEVKAQGRKEKWLNAHGELPAITLVHDLKLQSLGQAQKWFSDRCAEQIAGWLIDPANGFTRDGKEFQRLRPQDIAVLVRTGKEAAAVRRALQKRNVASVYLSDKDSVYQSDEARDLLHWLRAVATPQDAGLVRAALALGSVGLSLAELALLATDDEVFDEQIQILRELRQTWLVQGVLAMLRQSMHRFKLAARWLANEGGERSLTNYLHLAELLQNASADLEGEQALIRWLMNQIAENADQTTEQVVRLESDADLVKIVTIHASKGLQYPVVCLPFSTSFRPAKKGLSSAVQLPMADGVRELVLDMDDEALAKLEQERMREDLRLLYVALTRACHALWLGFAAVKVGNGKACKTQQSAIGYLVGGANERIAADWLERLQALADGCKGIALVPAPAQTGLTRLQARSQLPDLQAAPTYVADFDRNWSIASYSRLTRDLKKEAQVKEAQFNDAQVTLPPSALSPLRVMRPADDETPSVQDVDAAFQVEALTPTTAGAPGPIWHSFKRGPITGNWLHKQLDWLAGEGFALKDNVALAARLQARCERDGHNEAAPALVGWLSDVVHAKLPGLKVTLAQLPTVRSEMEFWLPARQIETAAVDAVCCEFLLPGVARPRLQTSTLHGMLMGFMDLVFEHEGRYWVLDYKSNSLGPDDSAYSADSLARAMAEHRYDVQAAIYVLALHRLLKSRLGMAYDPERQLGGAVCLFLRGMHGPSGGTCTLQPSASCLAALDAMLDPSPEILA